MLFLVISGGIHLSPIFSPELCASHPSLGLCSASLWQHIQRPLAEESKLSACLYNFSIICSSTWQKILGASFFCQLHLSNGIPDVEELDQMWEGSVGSLEDIWTAVLQWVPKACRGPKGNASDWLPVRNSLHPWDMPRALATTASGYSSIPPISPIFTNITLSSP